MVPIAAIICLLVCTCVGTVQGLGRTKVGEVHVDSGGDGLGQDLQHVGCLVQFHGHLHSIPIQNDAAEASAIHLGE